MEKSEKFESDFSQEEKEESPGFKNNTLNIFYRDNSVLPAIASDLERQAAAMGAHVNMHVFPAGMSEEEIRSEYESMKREIQGDIVADGTFISATHQSILVSFEELLGNATDRVMSGADRHARDYDNTSPAEKLEIEKSLFVSIFKKAQEKSGNKIKKLYILQPTISHHFQSAADLGVIHNEERGTRDGEYASYLEMWASEAGISEVEITENPPNPFFLEEEGVYLLYDRHAPFDEKIGGVMDYMYGLEGSSRYDLKKEKVFKEKAVSIDNLMSDMEEKFHIQDGADVGMEIAIQDAMRDVLIKKQRLSSPES
jgi:hypothetical protein